MDAPSVSELAYTERQLEEISETIARMMRSADDAQTSAALHSCGELLCAAIGDLQTAQRANDRAIFGEPLLVP